MAYVAAQAELENVGATAVTVGSCYGIRSYRRSSRTVAVAGQGTERGCAGTRTWEEKLVAVVVGGCYYSLRVVVVSFGRAKPSWWAPELSER